MTEVLQKKSDLTIGSMKVPEDKGEKKWEKDLVYYY